MRLRGTKALVVGLKKSGLASVELLGREGAELAATDLQPLANLPGAREALERWGAPFRPQTPEVFEDRELIVLSPDVPADLAPLEAARRAGARVIGEVELAAPFLKGRTIGVTGTNGKTTTTSLIGHILGQAGFAVQTGGNIGAPVTALIDSSSAEGWNVLELSSFQLETILTFHAHIALALNVTENHLNRHGSFARYAAAKARLFELQSSGDYAVLNADDAVCREYARRTAAQTLWFSGAREARPGAWLCGEALILEGEPLLAAGEVPLLGRHNLENVLAAALAAGCAGVPRQTIAAAVRRFRAIEHRLEFVRRVGGVDFYNDSKATSVDAALKAVEAFPGALWVILGGKDKGLDFTPLREPLAAKARAALLIGATAEKIGAALRGAAPLIFAHTLEAAVSLAYQQAHPGDTVLLAPACASFDQFRSFEHRGEVFKQIVKGLPERE
jgi:UDP-N-acetylmuramoylalanine--D-glutamate ligase